MFLNVGESPALLTGCKSQPSIDAASLSLFRYFGHFPSHLSLDIGMRPLKSPRVSKLMSTGAYSEKPGEMVEMDLDMFGSLRLPKPKLNRDPLDSRRVRAKAPLWLFWWLVSSDSGSLGKSKNGTLLKRQVNMTKMFIVLARRCYHHHQYHYLLSCVVHHYNHDFIVFGRCMSK